MPRTFIFLKSHTTLIVGHSRYFVFDVSCTSTETYYCHHHLLSLLPHAIMTELTVKIISILTATIYNIETYIDFDYLLL